MRVVPRPVRGGWTMFAPSPPRCSQKTLVVLLCSLAAVACGPPDEGSRVRNPGPVQGPFYLSNYFTPSGDMGDGQIAGNLVTTFNEGCKERPLDAGGDCYRFDYHVSTARWAGVYWVFPSNSWGAYPGRSLIGTVDLGSGLRGFKSVTFSAAIDQATLAATCSNFEPPTAAMPVPCASPPGLFVNFIAGGIDGKMADPQLPYSDVSCTGGPETCVPFKAFQGATLNTTWQTISIDLSNTPLTAVIGGFAWVSSYPSDVVPAVTPQQTIFIDDVIWE
jgi:hypothetical protein